MVAERLAYWDSCCFIHYIEDDSAYSDVLDAALVASGVGGFQIVTSVLSKAEVAFAGWERKRMDDAVEAKIEAMWKDRQAIQMVELSEAVADEARALIRSAVKNKWTGLKGADAVHLATAKWMGAQVFHTYDIARLKKYDAFIGMPIVEPNLLLAGRGVGKPATPAATSLPARSIALGMASRKPEPTQEPPVAPAS